MLRKLVFLFGDTIEENEDVLFDGNYKWLCLGGGPFLPPYYGTKVSIIISAVHVSSPVYGLGFGQSAVRRRHWEDF